MASSNIKLFDENKGNMLTDTEFNISAQRLNGLQTGVASSQLQNKAMYQASLVAYAIAQVMMQNGKNANDTDAVSAFVANLSGTMLQKVYDIATTEEAKAGVATGKWMSPALVKAAIDKTLTDKNYLPKSGGTMTGNLILNANPTTNLGAATKQYVDSAKSACLLKSGGTMTGNLILNANPTANLGAATKQYVDTQVNNVKSALTPVFGDMSKDGWFKLGDFTRVSERLYKYENLYNFLAANDRLSELAFVFNNLVVKNTNSTYGRELKLDCRQAGSGILVASIGPSMTATLNFVRKFSKTQTDYNSNGNKDIIFESYDFRFNNSEYKDVFFRTFGQETPVVSGTIEIWYK